MHCSRSHTFSKTTHDGIHALEGLSVEGDAHPEQIDVLTEAGFDLSTSQMGGNVNARGLDLLSLTEGALRFWK